MSANPRSVTVPAAQRQRMWSLFNVTSMVIKPKYLRSGAAEEEYDDENSGDVLDLLDDESDTERAPAMVLDGIASTPSTDRMGDIVDPEGAVFSLPIPFLWQHDASQPLGQVTSAAPNSKGIPVRIEIPDVREPGPLQNRLLEAMQSMRYKLVKGLSIGFAPIESNYMADTGGYRFVKWAWYELSAVTIPANAEASLAIVKSMDRELAPKKHVTVRLPKHATVRLPIVAESRRAVLGEPARTSTYDEPLAAMNQRFVDAGNEAYDELFKERPRIWVK